MLFTQHMATFHAKTSKKKIIFDFQKVIILIQSKTEYEWKFKWNTQGEMPKSKADPISSGSLWR